MERIGIIANPTKERAASVVGGLIEWLERRGLKVILDEKSAALVKRKDLSSSASEIPQQVDLAIVLGGDGTLLSVARYLGATEVPVLAVNLGRLGFLTEITQSELYPALTNVLNNQYKVEERMMVEAIHLRSDEELGKFVALNDVVVTKGAFARIINIETYLDDSYVTTYSADGLIISTPTGSTAYSLSAGGPIVHPQLDSLILTPICPHTLTNRPLIIPAHLSIRVIVKSDHKDIMMTIDGQQGIRLCPDDAILASKSSQRIRLITSEKRDYFQLLRTKLKWGIH